MDTVKLYRKGAETFEYWEAWEDDGRLIVHQGRVGEDGEVEELKATKSARERVRGLEQAKRDEGYRSIPEEELAVLKVVYRSGGAEPLADPGMRRKLEDLLDHTLGWTGLGHCEGVDLEGDTVVAVSLVVDVAIARRVIEEDLEGSEFGGYAEIPPA